MSMILTRSPLEVIGMNGAGTQKRRSARLSHEGGEENPPPAKKSRANHAESTTVNTKTQDGETNPLAKRRPRKVYDEVVEDFTFKKVGRKGKAAKQPAVRNSSDETQPVAAQTAAPVPPSAAPPPAEDPEPKTVQKKTRRRLPTTPEAEAAEKTVRRSKRLSHDNAPSDQQQSPIRPSHAKSHAKQERSPSPSKARPVTVEKKRKRGANGLEEDEKVMRIALPFQDTPVIKRNKEFRKSSADGHRRSSSGMRGRRASSMIDEGRGSGTFLNTGNPDPELYHMGPVSTQAREEQPRPLNRLNSYKQLDGAFCASPTPPSSDSTSPTLLQELKAQQFAKEVLADLSIENAALPHAEVDAAEFYKHISADLTEPRRMRCLLGWCGTRALPPKPEAPKDKTPASNMEFQALQAARVIQEELSQDLVANGTLSDWFSRDESATPRIPLRKKPNPRNITNAAKVEELEKELERLKKERAEWDALKKSAVPPTPSAGSEADDNTALSPLHPDLLDTPQRTIFEDHLPTSESAVDPDTISQRLQSLTKDLEFNVDLLVDSVHAMGTSQLTAERLADKTLADAAEKLEEREKVRRAAGKGPDAFDALKALGRVMNKPAHSKR